MIKVADEFPRICEELLGGEKLKCSYLNFRAPVVATKLRMSIFINRKYL